MGAAERDSGNTHYKKKSDEENPFCANFKNLSQNVTEDSSDAQSGVGHVSQIEPERCGFGDIVKMPFVMLTRIDLGLEKVSEALLEKSGNSILIGDAANALIHVREELKRSAHSEDGGIMITHDAALDLTTGLLDLADILFKMSFVVEALALEGIESHILEIMVTPWSKSK
jgi:hypothetical protein